MHTSALTVKTPPRTNDARSMLLVAVLLPLAAACVGAGSDHSQDADHANGSEDSHSTRRGAPLQPWHATLLDSEDDGTGAIEVTVRPGRSLVPPQQAFELPVAIEITARTQGLGRPPLDLSLVFDKSGSMRDKNKLAYTLQAAHLLIENLSDQDTVSIVAYDSDVVVLDEQQPAVQRRFLAHWLDEIEAKGQTNLSGGLLAGIAEVRRGRRADALARVILLTDGLANRGVTDPDGLRAIAETARQEGILVSTIGVGADFDEELLFALSDAGGGSYAYVPNPEDIPGVIARSIDGLLPVLCQNMRLTLELPEEVELLDRIVADHPDVAGPQHASDVADMSTIQLGDLVPGERRTVVLRLKLPKSPAPPRVLALMRARVDYQLASDGGRPVVEQRELRVEVANSREESEESVDMYVMDTAWLTEVFDLTYLALESRDWKLVDQARRTISAYQKDLEALADRDETGLLREHATLLAHYGEELERMTSEGKFHDHDDDGGSYAEIKKDLHYRRYLLLHHGEEEHSEGDGH